jgi:hypothetical protein
VAFKLRDGRWDQSVKAAAPSGVDGVTEGGINIVVVRCPGPPGIVWRDRFAGEGPHRADEGKGSSP